MIPEDFILRLKSSCDIENIAGQYVALKRKGRMLTANCPFHNEKTPSFFVYPESQSFYCFGCGAGGDVVTFVRRVENLEYVEALKLLAEKTGIPFPEDDNSADMAQVRQKNKILEINRELARFYNATLNLEEGKNARAYLKRRGLSNDTIKRFGLGYAPAGWDKGLKHLESKGYTLADMQAASVVSKSQKGNVFDAFRDRVIFPIIDLRGNVIGFGGRIMEGTGPKYLNSSDTPVFKKSQNLFAMNIAKNSKQSGIIIAEGYMDVIAMHQAGFDQSVATLGTALTAEQARLISKYTDSVTIVYDSDEAGQKATTRAIGVFANTNVSVKIIKVTGAKDPDEYIKLNGAVKFKLLLEGAANSIEYSLAAVKAKYDINTPDGKKNYLSEALSFLATLKNPVERDIYLTQTAISADVEKDILASQLGFLLTNRDKKNKYKEYSDLKPFTDKKSGIKELSAKNNSRCILAQAKLLRALIDNPDYYNSIKGKIAPADFKGEQFGQIAGVLFERLEDARPVDFTSLSSCFSVETMAFCSKIYHDTDLTSNAKKQELDDYIKAITDSTGSSASEMGKLDNESWGENFRAVVEKKRRN